MKKILTLSCVLLCTFAFAASISTHDWKAKVPEQAKVRTNPLAGDAEAPLAGAKLFHQHCAACHGDDAQGRGKKPSLRTETIQNSSDGELEWLLKNGSMRHGMPSWSALPEEQRWQIVSFLKAK